MRSGVFGSVEEALYRLFEVEQPPADWFNSSFLAAVPLDVVMQALLRSREERGSLLTVAVEGQTAELEFTHGRMSARALLDERGRIATLLIGPLRPVRLGVDEVARRINELAGETSIYVSRDGRDVVALSADREMAVASCFKLAVVEALRARIEREELAWEQIVHLESGWKSLPSGMLQDWPTGTAVTLETLAALAMSLSDNTATDALMDVVGRANVEHVGCLRPPVLTTREAFVLRDPANADLLQGYASSDITLQRAAMAACRERSLPPLDVISSQPRETTAATEWYSTARQLAHLADIVLEVPISTLGPSSISTRPWSRVCAKPGREPGIAALAAALRHRDGGRFTLAAIWNGLAPPMDEPEELARLVPALADALAEQEGARAPGTRPPCRP